ncbi:unnamed protein product, partial [Ixodes pacificus]
MVTTPTTTAARTDSAQTRAANTPAENDDDGQRHHHQQQQHDTCETRARHRQVALRGTSRGTAAGGERTADLTRRHHGRPSRTRISKCGKKESGADAAAGMERGGS